MLSMEPRDVRFFASPEELRDWFDTNHATADVLWLGYHKKSTGRLSVVWSQAVDEALCVGWIDGVLRHVDFSDEEETWFRADAAARSYWEGRPESYRKLATHWVTGAKQATTHERRFSTLLADSRVARQLKQTLWTSTTP